MHLLIADDDPTALAICRHLVASAGHTVAVATNGAAALAALTEGQFDAALLDLHMPVLDGAAVARAVRATLPPERQPRLIALSAAAPPGGEATMRALGFDAYLGKPLRLDALGVALAGGETPLPAPPTRATASHPTGDLSAPLLAAHAAGDSRALATAAAALKASATTGRPALAALAARLEAAIAAGDAGVIDELVRAIGEW